jgi:hypothetical protein
MNFLAFKYILGILLCTICIGVLPGTLMAQKKHTNAEISVPVGFTDLDDKIRELQLLGKIAPENSLTLRPYYTNTEVNYDSILRLVDTGIHYNGFLYNHNSLKVRLLPVNYLQKFNSDHPYGWNDGALNYSKGYQSSFSAGVYVQWRNLKIQLRPEYVNIYSQKYSTSAYWGYVAKPIHAILPGNSSIRLDLGPITAGVSNENLWWGPGMYNSLLMSNNAPGFEHISINTNRPLKTWIGNFQFNLMGATLTQNKEQGFENNSLYPKSINVNNRYLNSLNIVYQPKFFENVSFGLTRLFQNYYSNHNYKFTTKYLPVIGGLWNSAAETVDTVQRDQYIAFNVRYLFPKNHAEFYFEFGYNDAKKNLRDLELDMGHSSAYLLGFKKLQYLNSKAYLNINFEAIRMSQLPSYLMRNAGNWYVHGIVREGYTNQNQIMGAGSGLGNNMQTIAIAYNKGFHKIGLIYHHIVKNPYELVTDNIVRLGLRTFNWTDNAYGIQAAMRYKKLIFNTDIQYINSNNYQWEQGKSANNIYVFFNTTYLW